MLARLLLRIMVQLLGLSGDRVLGIGGVESGSEHGGVGI